MAWQTPERDPVYTFQSHMLLFVQPFNNSNETYVVDVGFGGNGLVRPVPLVAGEQSTVMGVGETEFHHLVKEPFRYSSLGAFLKHPFPSSAETFSTVSQHSSSHRGQEIWHLEVMHVGEGGSRSPWKRMYSFSEHEFFPADCEASSGWVTKFLPLFTDNVLAIRYLSEEGNLDGEMYRVTLFGNEVKVRRKNGETKVLAVVKTELHRVKVLREIFGIMIEDKDAEHIRGTPAQMKE
jgi:arylamine N-acetyltransferase